MKKNSDQLVEQLKKQLLEAQVHIDNMINIAEKELDINIRKKPDSKQPKK